MSDYKSLKVYSYMHPGRNIENEFQKRYTEYGTIKFDLDINAIYHGESTSDKYSLFLVPIPIYNSLLAHIRYNSIQITNLIQDIPGIARNKFFQDMLVKEIKGTNDIEGVYSTTKEINKAIDSVANKKKSNPRLHSFVSMYIKIQKQKVEKIDQPKDLRTIYDFLLEGEIPKNKYPDGKYFRNSFVRIGNAVETVHLPKADEQSIIDDLKKWIDFINNDDIDSILKACVAHYYLEYIHPFYDGNGRLGRYLFCSYIGNKLDPYTAVSFSYQINLNRSKYYKAFKEVENKKNYGEITFFVICLLQYLVSGQQEVILNLEEYIVLLNYIEHELEKSNYSEEEKQVLFIYSQIYLFGSTDQSIEDNWIIQNRAEVIQKQTTIKSLKNILDDLESKGFLKTIMKRPLKRVLTTKFFKSIGLDSD